MKQPRPISPLISRLSEFQAREGLSARQFAQRRLHVNASTWTRARRGDIGVGKKLLDAAVRAFPELSYLYVQVLQEPIVSDADSNIEAVA